MNIVMQVCGMIIVLFLFILYQSHRTLRLPSERVFRAFLLIAFANLLLDALSVVAIHYGKLGVISEWLMKLSCKSYIISMMWVGWVNFGYVSTDLKSSREKHLRAKVIMAAVTVFESILVAFLPINAVENGTAIYTEGPAVYAVYIFTVFYIVSTLSIAVYIRRKKSGRRGFAVIITMSLWILAAIIQFMNNELLLVGFSEAVGAMILYIVMENPDANLDKRLGCFNSYAFHEYIEFRMASGKDFCLLDVSIPDVRVLEEHGLDVYGLVKKIIRKLSSLDGVYIFKNDLANLVAIADNEGIVGEISGELSRMISEYHLEGNKIVAFSLKNADRFGTPNELLKFLSYVRGHSETRKATVSDVSEEMIKSYRNIGFIGNEIDAALEEDRVEVFLQPIYSNIEERVVAAEALVRIRKQDGTLMPPGIFIPIAEATGQVKELGERVLEKVCGFLKNTNAIELGIRCVDINLSAVQCDDSRMAGNLSRIVEKYGVDSSFINFEITETAVSTAKDTLLANMNTLVEKGFSFALDDFGKGESNLIYIVTLPVRFIKLDIDMSKAYFETPKAKPVVASITDMANKLGLQVVAEGIETQTEAEGIRTVGIQLIQGYYYSRPLPFGEFLEYLEKSNRSLK